MKTIYTSHSCNFDFEKLLYEPLKNSYLNNKVNLILPHEKSDEYYDTKGLFNSDKKLFILAELSYSSTGRDIELGMAFQKDISIIGIYKKGTKISSSQKFICKKLIEYDFIEDAISEFEKYIEQENL